MNNWISMELGQISSIFNGSTPSTNNEDYWNGDIIWITPKDLSDQNQKYILKGERTITQKALSNTKLLPKGTILLSSRAPIGLLSIALTELFTNQGFKNIVVNSEILHNEFLYYYLKLKKNELNNLGSGTTFKELSKSTLEKFKIKLPDLPTQISIAKVLSDLDAKIELNNRINRELEAMAKTLYDYWFVQFDFPNEQGKPYKSSGGKMVYNSELKREIPEGWEVKLLGSEIEIQRGISYTSKEINGEGIPMINLNSFNLDGTYKSEGVKSYSGKYTEKNILKSGDLLIAATDVTRNADIIGRAILVPDYYREDLVFSMDIAKIISSNIPSSFLMMLFNSSHYHNYIKWYATGTLVLHLNLDGVNRYKTEIPSNYLLKMFDKFYLPIANRIYLTNKQNQQLTALRDWLLPMLMNGQVTVSEL